MEDVLFVFIGLPSPPAEVREGAKTSNPDPVAYFVYVRVRVVM